MQFNVPQDGRWEGDDAEPQIVLTRRFCRPKIELYLWIEEHAISFPNTFSYKLVIPFQSFNYPSILTVLLLWGSNHNFHNHAPQSAGDVHRLDFN